MVIPAPRRWLSPVVVGSVALGAGRLAMMPGVPLWDTSLSSNDRTRLDPDLGDVYRVIHRFLPTRPVYVIRIKPSEIAGIAERYVVRQIDGFDPRMLGRVLSRRESGA
jgi:hypothetical protein